MAGDERVFVGLGANLGDAVASVRAATARLNSLPRTRLVAASSLYRTAPLDAAGPDYINAVAEMRTELEPAALLAQLQALEQDFGRQRPYHHAPRTLDLDLLFFGERRLQSPGLMLPHPRLQARAFVLAPLAELAPDWTCGDGRTVQQALAALSGQLVERIAPPDR
jgi:2-amino-4-hydroxy-6-hydroxymethyldihydropteridine diphosphokinase